jgi:nucleoside-diphosphate-sugar epimerase
VEALEGADVVVHLAAALGGDVYDQLAGTVMTTENLLEAMDRAGVRRIVLVSSFSVYDYTRASRWRRFDEAAPLEAHPERRDAYALTKLWQEELVREHAGARGWDWTVLRPGAIYGPAHLWTARLGQPLGAGLWLRIGQRARVPLTYVENCAQAIVMAAESDRAAGAVLNVVDDDPPTQRQYATLVRRHLPRRPRVLVVPRVFGRLLASGASLVNRVAFRGRAKVPGLLVPARFDARFKPVRYSNARIRAVLGWRPRYALEEALARCGRPESELLAVEEPADQVVRTG